MSSMITVSAASPVIQEIQFWNWLLTCHTHSVSTFLSPATTQNTKMTSNGLPIDHKSYDLQGRWTNFLCVCVCV